MEQSSASTFRGESTQLFSTKTKHIYIGSK